MGTQTRETSPSLSLLMFTGLGCLLLGFVVGDLLANWITGVMVGAVFWAVGAPLLIKVIKRKRASDLAAAEEFLNRPPVRVGVTADGVAVNATELAPGFPPGVGSARGTNTFAVLALVFGVLGGVLAIPFGHIARSQIRRTREGGVGLALAGLILGYFWLAALVAIIVVGFVLGGIRR
ncbi:DUF4190 domain-containing protein [Arthrobacter sp. 2MCAF14]|uniref:DUF4190 domain-containing protein n=1 Tax=Arthrobacter sp. 2MCAF14 TaxID=3232982 RepID=UPI003F939EF0